MVHGLAGGLEHALAAERMSAQPGLMQQLDPRTKLVLCLLLIFSGVLTHTLLTLFGVFTNWNRLFAARLAKGRKEMIPPEPEVFRGPRTAIPCKDSGTQDPD